MTDKYYFFIKIFAYILFMKFDRKITEEQAGLSTATLDISSWISSEPYEISVIFLQEF